MAFPPQADEFRSVARIYQLVSEFAAPIVVGLLVDWQFRTSPWGLLGGTLAGLVFGGLGVVRLVRQLEASDARAKKDKRS